MAAVLVEQQDGTEYPRQLGFHEAHEAVEHVLERSTHRDHFEDLRLPVSKDVRLLAGSDVVGDADQAKNLILNVAQRHLGRREPLAGAQGIYDKLFLVDHRLSTVDDVLLDEAKFLRNVRGMEIKIGQADHVARLLPATVGRKGTVDHDEAAFDVLDPQIAGHPVDQRLQRDALVRNQMIRSEFRNVLMRGHPAAVWHRLLADLNCPAVDEFGSPDS